MKPSIFTYDQVVDSVAIVFDRWKPTDTGDIAIVRRMPIEVVDFSRLNTNIYDTIKHSVDNEMEDSMHATYTMRSDFIDAETERDNLKVAYNQLFDRTKAIAKERDELKREVESLQERVRSLERA